MLKEAEQGDMLGDEERAYVLYMKYFNVVTFLKKSADYKKQKVKLNTRPYASYAGLSSFFSRLPVVHYLLAVLFHEYLIQYFFKSGG